MRISAVIVGIVVLFSCIQGKSQGLGLELYQYNYFYVNPAFQDSSDNVMSFMGNYFKINDLKRYNGVLSYQGNIRKLRTSIGFQSEAGNYTESFGTNEISTYGITVSHLFLVGRSSRFTIGTKVYNQRENFQYYRIIYPGDPMIGSEFPSHSDWLLDLGVVFTTGRFFSGFSMMGLSSDDRRYGAIGGYSFLLSDLFKSEHSVYTEFDSNDLRVLDINNKLIIRDKFLVGLTYRTQSSDGFIVSTGVDLFRCMRLMFLVYSNTDEKKDFKAETMVMVRI